ncbi:MAG TPA: phosphate signaling complex protein PhoU [Polyangia bacterium]
MKTPHLDHGFDDALASLRASLDEMATRAEATLKATMVALERRDRGQAKAIIAADGGMNALEMSVDDKCLKLLARWQPVAGDLRFVAAALKLTVDLERIGDHCVNIAERSLELSHTPGEPPVDVVALGETVRKLVHDAFEALRAEDVQQASQIIERGRQADVLVRDVLHGCFESMQSPNAAIGVAVRTYEIAGYLQRIAAHATNVAEMVVFLVRGEDVRHANQPAAGDASPPAPPTTF